MASFSVQYIFTLIDRFSPVATAVAAAAGRMRAAITAAGAAMAPLIARMAALAAGVGVLATAFVLGGVRQAAAFEEALTSLRRVTGISREEMLNYGKDALRIGVATGKTGEQIAGMMTEGALMGIRGKETLAAFADTVAKVSVTWDDMGEKMASRSLATLTAQWFNDLAPEQARDRLLQTADAINELSNRSAFKAPELLKAFERGGVAAKNFGLSAEQFAAYAGTALVTSEKSGELQGTRARMTFTKLQRAVAAPTKAALRSMKQLGLSRKQLGEMFLDNPQDAILNIMERLQKFNPIQQEAIISGLLDARSAAQFKAVASNINEYKKQLAIVDDKYAAKLSKDKGFMAWLRNGGEGLQELADQLERYGKVATRTGSVQREFERRTESLSFAWKALGLAFDRVQILAAMPALEPLRNLTNWLTNATSGIGDFIEQNQHLSSYLLRGAGVAGVAALGYGLLQLTAWATGAAGALAVLAGFGAIALKLTIVAAGVAAAMWIYDNWEKIKAYASEEVKFNIVFPDAPEWLKSFMADHERTEEVLAGKRVNTTPPARFGRWVSDSIFGTSYGAQAEQAEKYWNGIAAANAAAMPRPEDHWTGFSASARPGLDAGAVPAAAAERIMIESSVRTSIDPVQVNLSTNQIEVRYNGPIGGPASIGVSAPNTRGQSTVEAGQPASAGGR